MHHPLLKKGAGLFIVNACLYLVCEFLAALGTGYPLSYVYGSQFISALGVYPGQVVDGVPLNFSSWALIMNIGFILTAVGFFTAYSLLIRPQLIQQSKLTANVLWAIVALFCLGSLLVGFFQGGVPGQAGIHGFGARLSFIMGNATLLLVALFFRTAPKWYRLLSGLLAIIGFVAAYYLQMAILNDQQTYQAIFERLTVYPITLWQLVTGGYFFRRFKD